MPGCAAMVLFRRPKAKRAILMIPKQKLVVARIACILVLCRLPLLATPPPFLFAETAQSAVAKIAIPAYRPIYRLRPQLLAVPPSVFIRERVYQANGVLIIARYWAGLAMSPVQLAQTRIANAAMGCRILKRTRVVIWAAANMPFGVTMSV